MYKQGLLQLPQGILLGCSAYEELTSANPYAQNYPQIPYLNTGHNWQLGTNTDPGGIGYYNHAFAIVDLSVRKHPTDAVQIDYYQFPSWGPTRPANPASSKILSMTVGIPAPKPKVPVKYNDIVNLFCQEGLFISPLYHPLLSPYNYPTATTNNPVKLKLYSSYPAPISHGDVLYIETTESAAGSNNALGAWSTPTLYYYSGDYTQLQWTIYKKDISTGTQVNYGDEIYFVNNYYNQWLTLYWSKLYGNIYLTTQANANYYWQIMPPASGEE
jgi:hypothetical protein